MAPNILNMIFITLLFTKNKINNVLINNLSLNEIKTNTIKEELKNVLLFSGSSHQQLAQMIAKRLNISLGRVVLSNFSDRELLVNIEESVRDKDVYIIQSKTFEVDRNIMELLAMIQTCKLASAKRITAVMPYFPYSRQDKKLKPREPITAKLVANLLETAGANHIITMELHSPQMQAFFNIPCDNLYAEPVILEWIKQNIPQWDKAVIVSPDAGATKRCLSIAEHLKLQFALIHKQRSTPNKIDNMIIVGEVRNQVAIIVDDMADTCETLRFATDKLLKAGAYKVYAIVVHGILSGEWCQTINSSLIESLVVTNTIPQELNVKNCPKIKVIDVSNVVAEAIRCSAAGLALSHLFTHLPK